MKSSGGVLLELELGLNLWAINLGIKSALIYYSLLEIVSAVWKNARFDYMISNLWLILAKTSAIAVEMEIMQFKS